MYYYEKNDHSAFCSAENKKEALKKLNCSWNEAHKSSATECLITWADNDTEWK